MSLLPENKMIDPIRSRRSFLRECSFGMGNLALWNLLSQEGYAQRPHFATPGLTARAKNVIFMFMEGGPSQMDLFDPKPALQKWSGQSLPESYTKDLNLAFIKPTAAVLASPRIFTPAGQCAMAFSDFLPYLATCAGD